ncbi:hypothetical protein CRG98_024080 [Punica granatum]|nr:hypothetical protein CRG98_024080 [Punica granatum]
MKRKYMVISESDPFKDPQPMGVEEDDGPPLPPPENDHYDQPVPQPPDWFTRPVFFLADFIYNCLALLFSPISSLLYLASDSSHRVEEAKESMGSAVQRVPSNITQGSVLLIRKLGMGFLGAAYVCMVLMMVMVASVVVGVGLVRTWVEEPVLVRERLYFDYTDVHPKAVFPLSGSPGFGRGRSRAVFWKVHNVGGVPVGHTFQVSVLMLMPESDYNHHTGVFQLSAELLTDTGQVIAKSSQPCMLRFQSLPVRITRAFILGVPMILGIFSETQKVRVDILKHKEASVPRTDAVRVTLIPRAGTFSPPQLYEAEIVVNSQIPWPKKLVHNWKWTFSVWVSFYTYSMLLLALLCCCRPLLLSGPAVNYRERHPEEEVPTGKGEAREQQRSDRTADDHQERDVSELLRKLRRSRSRRKALLMAAHEAAGSSASSIRVSVTREETTTMTMTGLAEDDAGDSESVCLG